TLAWTRRWCRCPGGSGCTTPPGGVLTRWCVSSTSKSSARSRSRATLVVVRGKREPAFGGGRTPSAAQPEERCLAQSDDRSLDVVEARQVRGDLARGRSARRGGARSGIG